MARIILFDLNETLLDPSVLDPHFERIFGVAAAREAWFKQTIESALVATITNLYASFDSIQRAALTMTAAQHGLSLSEDEARLILSRVRALPPYPDVRPALEYLQAEGFPLVVLTNSPTHAMTAQLEHAGLGDCFDRTLSVDAIRRFKPHAETYQMVASRLGVRTAHLRLVSAHAWDIAGALRAGCAAAFVARPGQVLDPLMEEPDVIGNTLFAVARQIVEAESGVHAAQL